MRVVRVRINRFRGINDATLELPQHCVLIGDNNTGKTTVLEALDLVLGPDRLNRIPPIDEHDFFRGQYMPVVESGNPQLTGPGTKQLPEDTLAPVTSQNDEPAPPLIEIEVVVAGLSDEQKSKFRDYIEFWDEAAASLYDQAPPGGVDSETIKEAVRVTFRGSYDPEENDFQGKTYFSRSLTEGSPVQFSKRDKQLCGFLYLRSLRTGARALSLERGSLLDIILRLKEIRPQMWENIIKTLSDIPVAADPELGISPVLQSINRSLKKFAPVEWGDQPHLKISNLTREHLRKVITAFISTGEGDHSAPFFRQGTGTINVLVLAMLSQIAEDKHNVIFAMEEPETAIPPFAQKQIVHEIRKLASQAIFTSHSPYVLEEFLIDETVVLARDAEGSLTRQTIELPAAVKVKRYRQEFRTRFCEGLLARRVLIAEGATEASAFSVACRRLAELRPDCYSSLEGLGVCIVDAGGETSIPAMAELYKRLGKRTFAVCDKQTDEHKALIEAQVEMLLMHPEKGSEAMVLKGTTDGAINRFAKIVDWPPHLSKKYPDLESDAKPALEDYFAWAKGNWGIADFLAQCEESEFPVWLRDAAVRIKAACVPSTTNGECAGNGATAGEPAAKPYDPN